MNKYSLCLILALTGYFAKAQYPTLPRTMTPGLNQTGTTLQQVVSAMHLFNAIARQ